MKLDRSTVQYRIVVALIAACLVFLWSRSLVALLDLPWVHERARWLYQYVDLGGKVMFVFLPVMAWFRDFTGHRR